MALRWWHSAGGISAVAVLALARLGVSAGLFRGSETVSSHTTSCGVITWRSKTVVRKPLFDSPRAIDGESVLDVDGAVVLDDVGQWKCAWGKDLSQVALVTRRSDPQTILTLDGSTGRALGTWRFGAPVAAVAASPAADKFAVVCTDGAVAIVDRLAGAEARVVSRTPAALSSGMAWNDDGTVCWIAGARPESADQPVQLLCSNGVADARLVAHATWRADGVGSPFAAFSQSAAHLCGDAIAPRDLACVGLARAD